MNSILPSIMQSIKPQYCELIAAGKKTIEVRKTKPNVSTPFKSYKYCTKGKLALLRDDEDAEEKYKYDHWEFAEFHQSCGKKILGGKVIGEYICDEIQEWVFDNETNSYDISDDDLVLTCLTQEQLWEYGKGKTLYGYHITNLKIYDEPKELSQFNRPCKCLDEYEGEIYCDCLNCEDAGDSDYGIIACDRTIKRPPQSWCYVEEVS